MRFGLFGTGFWAEETHGAGLVRSSDVELVGVWGRNPAKAAALAEKLGSRPYDEVTALIHDVDAIAVALPPDVQAAIAAEAAEAGKHLLLDKPLSFTVADADRVVAAAEALHVASRVFFTSRFCPEIEDWLQTLASDADWDGAHITMQYNIYIEGNPYGGSQWRKDRGALWDIGPHALSQLIPVLGPVRRIVSSAGRGDMVHLVFTHDSGATSTATLSLTTPEPAMHGDLYFFGPRGISRKPDGVTTPGEAFDNCLRELLEAIDKGESVDRADVHFGRDVVAILADADAQLSRAVRAGRRP
ncbi:MAG: Gfo/Idh/MocA family oxidoreductase [Mycobacteriales bacterium]